MKKILFLSLVLAFASACNNDRFTGEGPIVEREIDLSSFDKINLDSSIDIEISQGNTQKVVAIGQDNIIDRLSTSVSGNEFLVDLLPGNYSNFSLRLEVTVADLEKVSSDGSGNITISSFSVDDLELRINGSGDITLSSLNADDVQINSDGSGNMKIDGTGDKLDISIDGSGDVKAFDFSTKDCTVSSDGSGETEVTVSEKLNVTIKGSGDVTYKGNPEITSNDTGSGELIDGN